MKALNDAYPLHSFGTGSQATEFIESVFLLSAPRTAQRIRVYCAKIRMDGPGSASAEPLPANFQRLQYDNRFQSGWQRRSLALRRTAQRLPLMKRRNGNRNAG